MKLVRRGLIVFLVMSFFIGLLAELPAPQKPENDEQQKKWEADYGQMYNEGLNLYKGKKYAEAAAKFEEVAKYETSHYEKALKALALSYGKMGNIEKMSAVYYKRIELAPNNLKLYVSFAKALKDEKKFNKAIDVYKLAATNNPGYWKGYFRVAEVYREDLKDSAKAIEYYEKALAADPGNADILYELAVYSYKDLKDYPKAKKYFEEILASNAKDKDKVNAYKGLGNMYSEQRNTAKAVEMYEEALALDYDSTVGIIVAQKYLDMKNLEKAEQAILKVLQNPGKQKAMANFIAGDIYKQKGELSKAKSYFQKATSHPEVGKSAREQIQAIDKKLGGQ